MRTALRVLAVFVVLALVALAVIGLRRPEVNIASVSVTGTHHTRADVLEHTISGILSGSFFFLIPRTSAFFYPKREVLQSARRSFPAIKTVSIARAGFTTLQVSVSERLPVALWCAPEKSAPDAREQATSTAEQQYSIASSRAPCYLMDTDGFVFAEADGDYSEFMRYQGGGVAGSAIGETFLDGAYPALRVFVADVAGATAREPLAVLVDEHRDVFVSFKNGGELRFAIKNANSALLENIASVFASKRLQSDDVLDYADFRFGNKIYVKFEGE